MLAIRVARGHTGKEKIIRWESHYHGWHDYVMPGTLPPFDVPASIGIPRGAVDSVIVLPSDLEALERTLAADKDVAGVRRRSSDGSPTTTAGTTTSCRVPCLPSTFLRPSGSPEAQWTRSLCCPPIWRPWSGPWRPTRTWPG